MKRKNKINQVQLSRSWYSPLLKSLSFTMFNFSCFLTSVYTLLSNSITAFFVFSKSFFLSYILCSVINSFHSTKYFTTPLIFTLFNIFSIFHSSTSFIFIGFISSIFCSSTSSLYLYLTTWLIFCYKLKTLKWVKNKNLVLELT